MTRLVREYRHFLTAILALNIVQMLLGIFFSVYVKQIIDEASAAGIRPRLWFYAALMLAWTAVGGFLGYWTTLYQEKIAFSVRKQVFHAVLRADWLKISVMPVGDLNSRISGDAGEISDYACNTFPGLVGAAIQLLVTAVIVYTISPPILLALIGGAVVTSVLMLAFRLKLKPLQSEQRKREVEASSYQTELCGNLMVVKILCQEENAEDRFQNLQDRKVEAQRRKYRFSYGSNTVLGLFFDLSYLLVFSWAVLNLGRGDITYGMLSMLISLEGYIQGPVATIASSLPDFVRMLISADRLNEVTGMDAAEETDDGALPSDEVLGVRATAVCFAYPGRNKPVIHDLSFRVPAGSFTVIQGASGCGKTTLLHLILSLLRPDSGRIELTGADGRTYPTGRSARRRMGYVPQGNTLFSGTILDNVCFGGKKDEEAAREALKTADALSFVEKLPQGLQTPVQENSRGLSVGQAQRIAIARSLYMRPAVLILDEATSALDRDTEQRILAAISRMPRRPTVLCVTHRETAKAYADQVIAMRVAGCDQKEGEKKEA